MTITSFSSMAKFELWTIDDAIWEIVKRDYPTRSVHDQGVYYSVLLYLAERLGYQQQISLRCNPLLPLSERAKSILMSALAELHISFIDYQ